MRATKYIAALALLTSLTGCATIQSAIDKGEKLLHRTKKSEATYVTRQAVDEKPVVPSEAEFTTFVPTAIPDTLKVKPSKQVQSAASKSLAKELDGEWQIVAVGSDKIELEDDMPYIVFESRTGRFYANNGCNVLNGSYEVGLESTITFSQVLQSMKYCPDDIFGSAISAMLSDGTTATASYKCQGHDSYIYLHDNKSDMSITLRCHNMDFLNGNWRVISINGNEIDDEEANVFFDVPQLKIHGNTGCNYFNGEIYIDPTRTNAIDFSQMSVTLMNCPKTKQETAMLVALEQTASAIQGDNGIVVLLDRSGNKVMELKHIKR